MTGAEAVEIPVSVDSDVALARRKVRELAARLGLGPGVTEAVATATSELARNIVVHAGHGVMTLAPVERGGRRGVQVVARDHGPGIADPAKAMEDGFTTAGGLGLGLPSARRFADEFELASTPGRGTTVTLLKWAE